MIDSDGFLDKIKKCNLNLDCRVHLPKFWYVHLQVQMGLIEMIRNKSDQRRSVMQHAITITVHMTDFGSEIKGIQITTCNLHSQYNSRSTCPVSIHITTNND